MRSIGTSFFATVCAGVFLASGALMMSAQAEPDTTPRLPGVGKLADGRTFGPLAPQTDGRLYDDEIPDLIAVVGDHGVEGYANGWELLNGGFNPATPEEALAHQAVAGGRRLPVYAADGETVIDTFTTEGPTSKPRKPLPPLADQPSPLPTIPSS